MSWSLATAGAFVAFGRARLQKRACSLATSRRKQRYANVPTYLPIYLAKVQIDFYGTTSVATLGVPAQQRFVARATLRYDVIKLLPLLNCTILFLAKFSLSLATRNAKQFSHFLHVRGLIVYSGTTALHLFLGYQLPGPSVESFALQATGYLTPSLEKSPKIIYKLTPRSFYKVRRDWRSTRGSSKENSMVRTFIHFFMLIIILVCLGN